MDFCTISRDMFSSKNFFFIYSRHRVIFILNRSQIDTTNNNKKKNSVRIKVNWREGEAERENYKLNEWKLQFFKLLISNQVDVRSN